MRKKLKFILPALLGIAALFAYFGHIPTEQISPESLDKLVIVSGSGARHGISVEIAATPQARETGLMFRAHMDPDHGMLFEMEQTGVTRFWMKNTLIPLDMLFMAPDGTIMTIRENAVPKSLTPVSSDVPVNAVLELNGGRARALGIVAGDKVVHPFFRSAKK